MTQWTRRDLLRSLGRLTVLAGIPSLVAACGGGGGGSSDSYGGSGGGGGGGGGGGASTLTCPTTPTQSYTISSNHGHTACIPQAVLDATDGNDPNVITLSDVGHTHTFSLTDAEVAQIKAHSATVAKTTLADLSGHSHVVTFM